jgi:hypothetical protein
MSELITIFENQKRIRYGLLATVSVLALCGAACSAQAAGDSHPPVWIELGGQFAQEQTEQEPYAPAFLAASPFATSTSDLGKSSRASWDGTAKLSLGIGDGWVFAAAISYGKTSRNKTVSHQTAHASHSYNGGYVGAYDAYQLFNSKASGSHTIVDFQAGRDVGLGNLGSSVLSAGVRFVQFNARTDVGIQSQPTNVNEYRYYHLFRAKFDATRHFNGIGPSISWSASANLFGNSSSGNIALDWGANGAILFGRQRVAEEHQTTDNYGHYHNFSIVTAHGGAPRSRNATIPNLGGLAGVSWQAPNAKVTLGYRADFFFGALDGGIDTAKKKNVGFYGPFASVSVGLGG